MADETRKPHIIRSIDAMIARENDDEQLQELLLRRHEMELMIEADRNEDTQ